MENLSEKTKGQLKQIEVIKIKASEASNTLNPAKAKRIVGEILESAVLLIEAQTTEIGELKNKIEGLTCCK